MKDLISREEVLNLVLPWCADDDGSVGKMGDLREVLDDIENLSSVESPEWRPCKDELPEEYGEYYVTWVTSAFDHPLVEIWEGEVTSEWDDERNDWKFEWLIDDYTKKNYPDAKVIAWMPLIEAYKENEHARDSN